ncbi:NADH:flavin oxidoreductase/NADH oxidase [Billgrantia endophytica]|uniref:NADH:flavin oxidoreductase / NADH oxidase n=1 Tax=Billgrantia endophytica TaxID=2033802 RepID=A0A2N7U2V8_9GAMM|nr:NADH:flavin oxidoreductase/NADH oxidase [Halomonas endophytica]PMR74776.1 NADH:flavin oxidoreductase / NADH oxidase [Halomonas endophytica]
MDSAGSRLFSPLRLRGLEIPNRVVISPMCQYSAEEGLVNDWHLVQLGRYALGGAGLVFTEASAVTRDGRITHGDLGIWSDEHIPGLRRLAQFLRQHGAVPAIQLGHAGRKGSTQRPWEGGAPLQADTSGEAPWPTLSASPLPLSERAPSPTALSPTRLEVLKQAYVDAAGRALEAGFEVIELHCAHGYLLHQFLSPLSNQRKDQYGGDRSARCRYPLEVVDALRACIPEHLPLLVRISVVDALEGGWSLEDSIDFASHLKAAGVDLIDCSSGGLGGPATAAGVPRGYGFQVPFAEAVRREADIPTMAVGLIVDAKQAEAILQQAQADLIAIAREALFNPNWALHAEQALSPETGFSRWPQQVGWWLANRARILRKLGKLA